MSSLSFEFLSIKWVKSRVQYRFFFNFEKFIFNCNCKILAFNWLLEVFFYFFFRFLPKINNFLRKSTKFVKSKIFPFFPLHLLEKDSNLRRILCIKIPKLSKNHPLCKINDQKILFTFLEFFNHLTQYSEIETD